MKIVRLIRVVVPAACTIVVLSYLGIAVLKTTCVAQSVWVAASSPDGKLEAVFVNQSFGAATSTGWRELRLREKGDDSGGGELVLRFRKNSEGNPRVEFGTNQKMRISVGGKMAIDFFASEISISKPMRSVIIELEVTP